MEKSYAIQMNDVKKSFKVYYDKGNTIKEKILFSNRNRYDERQVLNGISFKVEKGEAVGLIGSNGCGKSTTLKLLTKIIYPDSGKIEVEGRISCLLELGAGFHPDMSGRENIYTNASIFGLKKKEIDERLDAIVQFSELEEFIDNPVRTYSSGMYMRLAFSVAINVDADVLLIDEILAVGDVSFQKKCLEKIREIKSKGVTIVIVSHSLGQIEEICDKSIWLDRGNVKKIGEPKEIHAEYQDSMEVKRLEKMRIIRQSVMNESLPQLFHKLTIRNGNGIVRFQAVWLEDTEGKRQEVFKSGDEIVIKAEYSSQILDEECIVNIAITRQDGILCFATNNMNQEQTSLFLKNNGVIQIKIMNCNLLTGSYMLNIGLTSLSGEIYDDLQRVLFFRVEAHSEDIGICMMKCKW